MRKTSRGVAGSANAQCIPIDYEKWRGEAKREVQGPPGRNAHTTATRHSSAAQANTGALLSMHEDISVASVGEGASRRVKRPFGLASTFPPRLTLSFSFYPPVPSSTEVDIKRQAHVHIGSAHRTPHMEEEREGSQLPTWRLCARKCIPPYPPPAPSAEPG